ncbi:ras and EF-hand domain-containing protein homolog isoform X1 [Drosophila ficusphila]|uniref:ras and EF-hand domain-containing protein homolog isoform X1 n=1 Tax=Drosophila ficusphila TaxID=30025 RepID=UPI0007E87A4D|nr:ras and EF-hand domain-containing protein homolog isoform X1 [Drosophila ficusphila]
MPNVDEPRVKAIKRVETELSEEKPDLQEGQGEPREELEEEASGKIKGRSRFSAALRSLSKSKAKRERELDKSADRETRSAEEEAQETPGELEDVASSISTDSGALGKTKKKSLTRRLLLGGLRKTGKTSKVRPHSLATSDDLSVEHLEATPLPSPPGSPSSAGSSTLQITISGKKVEPSSPAKKSGKSRPKSDTDYLTPAAEEKSRPRKKTTTTTVTTRADSSSTRTTTKLLVAKKKPQSPEREPLSASPLITTTNTTNSTTAATAAAATESTRDTPPRERAPAKPSRVQSASGTGAVRKSQSSSGSSRKLELMQQQQQRGHRLNARPLAEPASLEATLDPSTSAATATDTATSTATATEISFASPPAADDGISSAESAQTLANPPPVVRFAVGSAVRSPLSAYEAALAAAASQQPNSNEELSDSSLRRLNFAQQQLVLGDHDSIEGRRETLRYQSVASEYSNQDSGSEDESEEQPEAREPESDKPMPAFGDLTMDQEMEPAIMTSTSDKREHLYKILVIGELGTGKTSFIKRYVHQFFSQNYRATIGVDFALKVLQWDANTIVRLQLWDIAGQERFGNMTRVYYKEAVGAFIVFDVTRSGTFDCVSKWKEDLDSKVQLPDGSPIPCILLANKCDQEKQGIITQPEKMDEYVRENGFAGWFETSAKENINIDEAARALVNKILINDKLISADLADGDKFNLSTGDAAGSDAKNKCSC